ncbi:MAG TPA: hypothetical protein VFQ44_11570 [Streptosporangiaceae bacterium]|nr:hypothetical protein [Streptosporangiaceae bacterium]
MMLSARQLAGSRLTGILSCLPLLHHAPADLQHGLCRIFQVNMTYNHDTDEATLRAVITESTTSAFDTLT